jgi:hypothetical protein
MNFLPWYNLKLINFLDQILTSNLDIFEYGGGNSTLYYAKKVRSVSTVESKKEWLDFVINNKNNLQNIEIKMPSEIKYFDQMINKFLLKTFDIIVIDSRDRSKCLIQATKYIKKNGLIILDNSERVNLINAKREMIKIGFNEKLFCGFRNDGVFSISSIFSKDRIF